MVFAVCLYKTLLLVYRGDAVSTGGARPCCPTDVEYSWCALAEDLRSLLSFGLGILMCCFMESRGGADRRADDAYSLGGVNPDKTRLYAFVM